MKRIIRYLAVSMLLFSMCFIFSCKPEDDPTNGGNDTPQPGTVINGPDLMTFTVNGVSFDMIKVEGSTFWMGAQSSDENGQNYDENAFESESPVHQVALSDYYIGKYEVSQELWQAVMGTNPSHFPGELLPMENVGPNAIRDFLFTLNAKLSNETNGLQFKLPTEAQWEFAARGGKKSAGYRYSGSNNSSAVAWCSGNSGKQTHPIGSKEPNELFLYDMSGNVAEWCNDYAGVYVGVSQTDPIGPSQEFMGDEPGWIVRGGSWKSSVDYCRSSARDAWDKGTSYYGFRLALTQDVGQATIPGPRTREVSEVTKNSAFVKGALLSDGGSFQTEWGFCYGTSSDLAANGTKVAVTNYNDHSHEFSETLTDLQPGTKYYVCAYAKNSIGTGYGETVEFTTRYETIEVTTLAVTDITNTTAVVGGVIPNSNSEVIERGICYGLSDNPTSKITVGSGTGEFTTTINGLRGGTKYYVRAYAKLPDNTICYGNIISFTTAPAQVPTVETVSASTWGSSYGCEWAASGKIINNGGADINYEQVGILVSVNPNPTWQGGNGYYGSNIEWTNGYPGIGNIFTASWGGLDYNKTYYFRAFAVNSAGVGYGEILEKTTGAPPTATITTNPVTNITSNTAVCGGNVSTTGQVMVRGICWSTSPDPVFYVDNTLEAYATTGSFSLTMTGLTPNTTYYVRAYADGYMQGGYGETKVFTTLP